MGFSGGGSNVTKAHTHDSTVVQDGGSLAANVTQFGLSSGSILYSDGSNIQELSVGAGGKVLAVSGSSLPEWVTPTDTSPLIKVSKTFEDITDDEIEIYTLPAEAALVNIWTDITTVFDLSTAITIGDTGDPDGFVQATDWTAGTGLTDATRGAYVTSFKTMRNTSGTTDIKAYDFSSGTSPPIKDAQAYTTSDSASTTITESGFTVASNSDRILIVSAGVQSGGQTISGITWNGVEDFTRAVFLSDGLGTRTEMWYLLNPTDTTADVVTTWSTSVNRKGAGVYSYYNVVQVDPIGITNTASGSSTTTTGTITPTTAGSLIVDVEISESTSPGTDTLTAGWTTGLISIKSFGSQYDLTPTIDASNDMFYTYIGSVPWCWCAIEVKSASSPAGVSQGEVDFYLQVVD